MEIKPIAHIRTDFPEKFGIPRQSGLSPELTGIVVFEEEFRVPAAVEGLDGFSHIWLLWEFSANRRSSGWQPTVRPPRLGGNSYMGVFATRSPYRPNPLGLSCVQLEKVIPDGPEGPVLVVRGADLMDGTPIYDIKPYIKYADSHPEAVCGYVDSLPERTVKVVVPEEVRSEFEDQQFFKSLIDTLSLDPRPSYHDDPTRVYGMSYAAHNVKFTVAEGVLTVVAIEPSTCHAERSRGICK